MSNVLKLAICQEIFRDLPFPQICQKIAQIGYAGIEIAPFKFHSDIRKLHHDDRRSIIQTAINHNIELVAAHWLLISPPGLHITTPIHDVYSETKNFFNALIEFAHDLGIRRLIFGSPRQRSIETNWNRAQALQQAVDFFRNAGDTARRYDILIAIEPLGPSITNLGGSLKECQTLLHMIQHPNIKVMLDTSAMLRDPLPPMTQLTQLSIEDLVHVHVNDPNQLGPGMGDFDLHPLVKKLLKMGYRNWYSVETFRNDISAEEIAQKSYLYMKKILE